MIKVSDTAKRKVVELMTEEGYDPSKDYVRVGVKAVVAADYLTN